MTFEEYKSVKELFLKLSDFYEYIEKVQTTLKGLLEKETEPNDIFLINGVVSYMDEIQEMFVELIKENKDVEVHKNEKNK